MVKSVTNEVRQRYGLYGFFLGLCLAVGVALGVALPLIYRKACKGEDVFYPSVLGNYSKAAVATDGADCARIGGSILEEHSGSAVDAAIGTLICMGLVIPHSMGLGGGFLMTIYKKNGAVEVLDAREVAPKSSFKDMYENNSYNKSDGGMSVAVPGELLGYQMAHARYGHLNWSQLFEPTISLARKGFYVGKHLAAAIEQQRGRLRSNDSLWKLIYNEAKKDLYKQYDVMKNEKLADTLEMIANANDSSPFYTGQIAKDTIDAITKDGGIMTLDDLESYKPRWSSPIKLSNLTKDNLTLYSVPPPGSGALLAFILNIVSRYDMSEHIYKEDPALFYHRMLEAYKFAYAKRTQMEDKDSANTAEMDKLLSELISVAAAQQIADNLLNDSSTYQDPQHYGAPVSYSTDHGTAHVCVLAANGDAVAVSSTINLYFGSRLLTPMGILLNDEMDDFNSPNITNSFGVPPSNANLIVPGRRPFSSMAPSILVDGNGDVRMVVGGSGGTHITTSIASVILRSQWLDEDIKKAIDAPRIHHQLYPNRAIYEKPFSRKVLSGLTSRSHVVSELSGRGGVVEGIVRNPLDGRIYANADFRKRGAVDGY